MKKKNNLWLLNKIVSFLKRFTPRLSPAEAKLIEFWVS